ncbi:hypothetical protein [Roseinatronobacter sp.]|uniref:hypothetical protein n=1 Tax=Roseinatronobacter sp. TaxID=1945755 RepID=UPI003F6FD734
MLRLNISRKPVWLEFGPGVRVQLLPADIELVGEAQADPEFVAALGGDAIPGDDAELVAMSSAQKQRVGLALAIALAKRAIIAWEGMEDEDGTPIPEPFDEGVEALLRIPSVFRKFQDNYMAPAMYLAHEGNGSGASLSGISAVVPNTARPARRAAKPARKSKTRR